ncbi:MAG: cupin domain-containing protein [Cyclobacteriaceae bacterium]|nr:cupin domain-containing protein [Cyclobacteriaceae bacterium]
MNRILFLVVLIAMSGALNAQSSNAIATEPFKIDDRFLSGLDIPQQKLSAFPEREYFQKTIYSGADLNVYILSSETAANDISSFPIDEFVYYISGRADVEPSGGARLSFSAGDYIFVPKGFSGKWTNNGNKYHLELSVISRRRADTTLSSQTKVPKLLNRELISGVGLTPQEDNKFSDVLHAGVELEIAAEAEEPTMKEIKDNAKDLFIHVLGGSLTLATAGGKTQTFYRGDFFVLPKGFTGTWVSEGQNLFRYLKVSG